MEKDRRRFLGALGALGATAVVGCDDPPEPAPEPAPERPSRVGADGLPPGLDPAHFQIHGRRPWTLETRREALAASVVTATDRLFVRNNLAMPEAAASPDEWSLAIGARTFTLGALKRLGLETVAMVLQCSGNGRRFFEHGPSGSAWGVGAAGCVIVSGVPLRAVVEAMGGVPSGARFVTATGADPIPEDVARDTVVVERSVPLDKALQDGVLGWEMNGEPLPHVHGGPLRLFVPGYFGCNQVKWLKALSFTAETSNAKIMRTGYRLRPIGQSGAPDQPSMWAMPVKSWIVRPATRPIVGGKTQVVGVAFSGEAPVVRVEWSNDGEAWEEARFVGPNLGPFAWRLFSFEVNASDALTLFTRATDSEGNTQPEGRVENERGYGNTSWRDMGVVLRVCEEDDQACLQPPEEATSADRGSVELSDSGRRGQAIFASIQPACGTCHTLSHAGTAGQVGPALDGIRRTMPQIEATIRNGIGAMPSFGPQLSEGELRDLATYVFEATR
ncbi:MAG: molybdopterin-dependent oxidoreductase [Myxococcota bacterium]